jgi:hypothetical protein
MLHKPSWIPKAVAASVVALAAASLSHASQAAPETCLSAPSGASPQGQHWYYRFDRVTRRKCWYLHETAAMGRADAVAPPAGAERLARRAAPVETVRPARRAASSRPPVHSSAQPDAAFMAESKTFHRDEADADFAAPKPADTKTVAPLRPGSDRLAAQSGATPWPNLPAPRSAGSEEANATPGGDAPAGVSKLWPDPPAPGSARVQEADATPTGGTRVAASTTADTRATSTQQGDVMQQDSDVASAAASGQPSSLAEDLLIIALAAGLAAVASAIFAMVLRRRSIQAKPADLFPRFSSNADRQSVGRSKLPLRKTDSTRSVPVDASRVPQHLAMGRPFAAPWWQERMNLDERARID